jgi:DNA invertase Pin-like site-specific DNA recombinase
LTNQERLQRHYALRQRALQLGWREDDIDVLDVDLGLTAVTAEHRAGFQDLVTHVTRSQVGLILSLAVTRLSRTLTDGYPLLDLCGDKGCLIADRDGVYEPAPPNGRLLLGLTGPLSAMEMPTSRARLPAGLLPKAARGALALALPIGLGRDPFGQVQKTPALAVQHGIERIFATLLRVHPASTVFQFFTEPRLSLPGRARCGALEWQTPTVSALIAGRKNPAYAGAFVSGRSQTMRHAAAPCKATPTQLPLDAGTIRVTDKDPASMSWETYVQIRAMRTDNDAEDARNKTRGIPRAGAALLHGLLDGGEGGHQRMVQDPGGTLYRCHALRQQCGVPGCQHIPAAWSAAAVVDAFVQALSPIELEIYARAVAAQRHADEQTEHARQQHLERLRYQAALAQRQYHRCDPDHRLVAADLEARWEAALRAVQQAEDAPANDRAQTVIPFVLTADLQAAFSKLGARLPPRWGTPVWSQQQRKALLRCLIAKGTLPRVARSQAQVRLVWHGGETTPGLVPVQVKRIAARPGAAERAPWIRACFAEGHSDEAMAQQFTERGQRAPASHAVFPHTVRSMR